MNAKKLLKEAAYRLITQKPIENIKLKTILDAAEVSKQTFYRYYADKYELANELYYELTQKDIIDAEMVHSRADWEDMYLRQFRTFRQHMDFVKLLYTSKETGCTLDYEIESTIKLDKILLSRNGADITDPRIMFAIEAKDVGGTYAMRDWILGNMQVADEEMVQRFLMIIPHILLPYIDV